MHPPEFIADVLGAVRAALETGDLEHLDQRLDAVTQRALAASARTTPVHRVTKVDEDRQLVYGWALVSTERGASIVDLQDDVVDTDDLRDTAHAFVKGDRTLGRMHVQMGVGEVVESVVFTKALQDALGIDLGCEGWFIGVHVTDPETWQSVKKGELTMFSIGGSGVREPLVKGMRRPITFREALRHA
jgi:hypothetical protein